jgi:hypothetical protein
MAAELSELCCGDTSCATLPATCSRQCEQPPLPFALRAA